MAAIILINPNKTSPYSSKYVFHLSLSSSLPSKTNPTWSILSNPSDNSGFWKCERNVVYAIQGTNLGGAVDATAVLLVAVVVLVVVITFFGRPLFLGLFSSVSLSELGSLSAPSTTVVVDVDVSTTVAFWTSGTR